MGTEEEKKKYIPSEAVTNAQQALQNYQTQKPGQYQSQNQQQMTGILNQYNNRAPFQYDVNEDALYQQMVNRYLQMGKQGMMDTMGQSAALTGGYGNSWAQTAGQQTYQNYLQGVTDMMPQYYQMAADRYQMEGDQLLQQYGLLADRENREYSRYMDMVNRYYSDLDRLQNAYDTERNFDYGQYMDQANIDQQAWENAWRLYQEDIKTPEVMGILGIPNEPVSVGGSGDSTGSGGGSRKIVNTKTDDENKKALDFVENMLDNATSSRFDPNRAISGTNALTDSQKKTAQEYLNKIISSGAMKQGKSSK